MRLIHTADWHLGQTLLGQSRHREQQLALDWLYELIVAQEADALVVAGDVFDVASPAEDARKMYYDFLARLARGPLKWVIVVAGNHDSPRMIGAVQQLASAFDIHIVAAPAANDPAEGAARSDLLRLVDPQTGQLAALVAAVPFLQERYVRTARAGEALDDKERALAAGIHAHYERLAAACTACEERVPLIATGHLYASGAEARDGQDNIYVGKMRNLNAADLPSAFDYVALGHIHRPQALRGAETVRYSGSLIALDFQESADEKGCWCVDLAYGQPARIAWHGRTQGRRLKRLSGSVDELLEAIESFGSRHRDDELAAWLELEVVGGAATSKERAELRALAERHGARVLKIVRRRARAAHGAVEPAAPLRSLQEVSVDEVFAMRCADRDLSGEEAAAVTTLFGGVLADVRAGKVELPA